MTFSTQKQALFCTVCIAPGKPNENNFISGYTSFNVKHIYERIREHEISSCHRTCVDAHLMLDYKGDIISLLAGKQRSAHNEKVDRNRQMLIGIITVIKLIGKRGLSFRGKQYESAKLLLDTNLDHGNFLEILLLLSEFDPVLQNYIEEISTLSKNPN